MDLRERWDMKVGELKLDSDAGVVSGMSGVAMV